MSRMARSELREMLGSSELLEAIPEHELDELTQRVRRRTLPRGQVLFMKGDEGSSLMFVASGRVKIISLAPSGSEVIHNLIEAGQIFGEMALLDGKPRSADAVSAVDSEVFEFSRQDFLAILKRNPDAAIRMMEILCGRIRRSTDFVEDAVLLDAGTRLLHRIRALADQFGSPASGSSSLRIDHGLSQQEIGESVGLTRVSVNRLLGQWRVGGLIEDGRGYIVVHCFEALEKAVAEG